MKINYSCSPWWQFYFCFSFTTNVYLHNFIQHQLATRTIFLFCFFFYYKWNKCFPYIYFKSPLKNCQSVDPVTTCKDPPALFSLVLLPSANVTWMSDCGSTGASVAVEEQHLIQPQEGWELPLTSPCWMMQALPILLWSSTATFQPLKGLRPTTGSGARTRCSPVLLEMRSF